MPEPEMLRRIEELLEPQRYYLHGVGQTSPWVEVSKEFYVQAERAAGFHSKFGPGEVATDGFSNGAIEGRVEYERTKSHA